MQTWDAIIVGTGMGGATLGYALAKAGKTVLFCEKGYSHLSDIRALKGDYAESFLSDAPQAETLARAGRSIAAISDISSRAPSYFVPFLGSGTGGSSALFGMAMDRFFPCDFYPRENYSAAEETSLPERWPIDYAMLAPFYRAAESLYRVRGESDPLRVDLGFEHLPPAPSMSASSTELSGFLKNKNLHPYRLPLACEFVSGCQTCQGYLCSRNCKNDSAKTCLAPAVADHGAQLLDQCRVVRLEANRGEVTTAICLCRGQPLVLKAKIIVLAAGALETPGILLRSSSRIWPQGLANNSGMVGRNLMRHHIDLYLLRPRGRREWDSVKELAFNDLYQTNGQKFGSVQSFGPLPSAAVMAEAMEQEIRDRRVPGVAQLFRAVKPLAKKFLGKFVRGRLILAAIMEDLPYLDNRVLPSEDPASDRLSIHYRIRDYDRQRGKVFRSKIKSLLRPNSVRLVKQAENNRHLAHACGTCRFGTDPAESVLDMNNRAHGLSNLYVVDSSFFPSSAGTNPSLTIAANALRVAEGIVKQLG